MIRILVKYYLEISLHILVVPMLIITFGQVIFRYILRNPPMWTEEASRYLFVWVCYMGTVYAFRKKEHIVLDLIYKRLPPRWLPFHKQLINIIVLLVLLAFVYYGIGSCANVYGIVSPALLINMAYINAALPAAGIMMLCCHIYFMFKGEGR